MEHAIVAAVRGEGAIHGLERGGGELLAPHYCEMSLRKRFAFIDSGAVLFASAACGDEPFAAGGIIERTGGGRQDFS